MSALVGQLPSHHHHHTSLPHHSVIDHHLWDSDLFHLREHCHNMRRSQRNIDRANRNLQTVELLSIGQDDEIELEINDGLSQEDPPSPKPFVPNGQLSLMSIDTKIANYLVNVFLK